MLLNRTCIKPMNSVQSEPTIFQQQSQQQQASFPFLNGTAHLNHQHQNYPSNGPMDHFSIPNSYPRSYFDPVSISHQKPINKGHSSEGNHVYDVWAHNFSHGMRLVRRLVRDSVYVAVDTEFPGVVAKVFGEYSNSFEQAYHNIKVNIDMLKPIQIGFSFFDEKGRFVDEISTVQFNMKWNVDNETHAVDSIQLLELSGIDFGKLKQNGIDLHDFAEAFLVSGLALNENITWIGFHSAYDFAYMMKICTDWMSMPNTFSDFQKLLVMFFPKIVDLKALVNENKFPKGGLQELADCLQVDRKGVQHQAGSDAMLTGEAFFRFLEEHTKGQLDASVINYVYGLNYCPNGINNQSIAMNMLDLLNNDSDGPIDKNLLFTSTARNGAHSADHSGRNSPSDSNSGHKSS